MTELSIRPEEIRDALQKYVEDYKPSAASKEEVGRVAEAGDGIARVTGLPSAMANELLEFEDGTQGLALNLDTREIGVVILGDFAGIEEGQTVRRTGDILSVPIGDNFLGRVIDPLGNPIDGLGDIEDEGRRALELFQHTTAHTMGEKIATVYAARELSDDERSRLAKALGSQYDTTIHLLVVQDPEIVGGIRVEIGDDIIDGTVSGRLEDAQRRLVG